MVGKSIQLHHLGIEAQQARGDRVVEKPRAPRRFATRNRIQQPRLTKAKAGQGTKSCHMHIKRGRWHVHASPARMMMA